ncbi:hypothetical protein PM082_020006 [Marasmius tenuissimus]|nr:hypothetical protein PM082_020006 [Marasmius tenuissimus]
MDGPPIPGLPGLNPLFIGNLFEASLFGIATIQVMVFLQRPVSRWEKLACVILWCSTLLHLIAVIQFTYENIFIHEGDLREVHTPWNYSLSAVLDLLISPLTQIVYAFRLWKIIKRTYFRTFLFAILGLLLAFSLSLAIYVPYRISGVPMIMGVLTIDFKWAVALDFCLTAVIDCILSATIVVMLYRTNKRLDWTDSQFYVFVAYVVNSGALASLFSIIPPIMYLTLPLELVFLPFRFVLTALYFNSLLAMLNAQYYLEDWGGRSNKDVYVYNGSGFRQRPSQQPLAPRATINEVGLPLFDNQNRLKIGQMDGDLPLVQVNVAKEEVHQSELDSKNHYHREGSGISG